METLRNAAHAPVAPACVDRRDALRPDGKLRLLGIVEQDLHSVLPLRGPAP